MKVEKTRQKNFRSPYVSEQNVQIRVTKNVKGCYKIHNFPSFERFFALAFFIR